MQFAKLQKRKSLQYRDLAAAVRKIDQLEFLHGTISHIFGAFLTFVVEIIPETVPYHVARKMVKKEEATNGGEPSNGQPKLSFPPVATAEPAQLPPISAMASSSTSKEAGEMPRSDTMELDTIIS